MNGTITMIRRSDSRGNVATMTIGDACLEILADLRRSAGGIHFPLKPSDIAATIRHQGMHESFDGTRYEIVRD